VVNDGGRSRRVVDHDDTARGALTRSNLYGDSGDSHGTTPYLLRVATPGSVINGRYEVISALGSGAQGEVYEVRDLYQDEVVALKFLTGVYAGPWDEAIALTMLRDDHILPIRNADTAAGVRFVVTELATDGTIASYMASAPAGVVPADTAIRWTRDAAQATERTHAANLLHTDIKPPNMFLNGSGHIRLGDYGLASVRDAVGLGHTSGTAETLAPEVASAIVAGTARATSIASDVYSLGATMYWMLAGQPPFQPAPGHDLRASAPVIAAHRPTPIRDVAPHVSQTLALRIGKAMNPDPAARYGTAGEFAAALGSCPAPERAWVRTNEHATHAGCWRGDAAGKSTVLVCAEVAGRRAIVTATKLPSGRSITGASATCSLSALPATLRRTFKACS
jgi:serine/threonine-protein kinase